MKRLDQRLRELHAHLSWARVRHAITRGQVLVDGVMQRDPGALVAASSVIDFEPARPALPHARLDIPRLYDDEGILVVDKPAGLLSGPTESGAAQREGTGTGRGQE